MVVTWYTILEHSIGSAEFIQLMILIPYFAWATGKSFGGRTREYILPIDKYHNNNDYMFPFTEYTNMQ